MKVEGYRRFRSIEMMWRWLALDIYLPASPLGKYPPLATDTEVNRQIHSAIASWIHSYFDNIMTKFMINNRTDA